MYLLPYLDINGLKLNFMLLYENLWTYRTKRTTFSTLSFCMKAEATQRTSSESGRIAMSKDLFCLLSLSADNSGMF